MTDEEANALDERWTKTNPRINPLRPGVFARQWALLDALDAVSANYILNRAEATRKSPAQIIGEMVRERITAP
jgi:hypothetical protein